MEKHITKIYVDSPVFGPEDEEVYQYIDPHIGDSGGLRLESEDTLLQIQAREADDGLERESADFADSGRYEDMSKRRGGYHSNRSRFAHQQSAEVQQKQRFVPSGANRMYEELNDEEEEERREMERRNRSQRRQVEQNHIPQLDLIDSDDEKIMHQGFTDLEINEGRNPDAYEKTAEMVWTANQRSLLSKGVAEGGPGPNPAMQIMENVPQPYYTHETETNELGMSYPGAYMSAGFQHQLSPAANEGSFNPQNQSYLSEAHTNFQLPINSQILPNEVRGYQPFQPYTIHNAPPLIENNFSSLQPMQSGWAPNHHGIRYQQRRCSDSSLIKILPTARGVTKSKDFVQANKKEVVKKDRPKKMYGDMFSKRKKKENIETGPPFRRHSEEVLTREPAQTNTFQNMSGGVFQQPFPMINQQPFAVGGSQPAHQLVHHITMPMPSMANPSVFHPVERQQQFSIPIQLQGVPALEQQNVSVDINLRLVSPDLPLSHQQGTTRKPVQQPKLTGHHLAYNQGTSTAVGLPMTDGQPMVTYGVLPPLAMNPYMVLPPVGDSVMNQHAETEHLPPVVDQQWGSSIKTSPKGGYAEQLKRQNQPPQYKEYTLGDYRRLKKEIKTLNLGRLGPELDTEERIGKLVKEKRKQQYSKQVKQRNRLLDQASRSHRESAPADNHLQQDNATDRRTIALEYAKTVPKPRITHHESDNHVNDVTTYEHECNRKVERRETLSDELEELQLLKERHNLERKQLELIEMGVKTILAQNA